MGRRLIDFDRDRLPHLKSEMWATQPVWVDSGSRPVRQRWIVSAYYLGGMGIAPSGHRAGLKWDFRNLRSSG